MHFARLVIAAACATAFSTSALAESCANTTFSDLAATSCLGSFSGNINGNASEVTFLNAQFGGAYTYVGKSDDLGNGPFTSNPQVSKNGKLTFDTALSGLFVIGLKAANQYSFYQFNAQTPVSSLTFDSTAGVALNGRGIAQNLSHANLYMGPVAAVPEPETYAMMLAGLAFVGVVVKRRKASQAA